MTNLSLRSHGVFAIAPLGLFGAAVFGAARRYHSDRGAAGDDSAAGLTGPQGAGALSNNVMQLTKGGWMRMEASSSARSS